MKASNLIMTLVALLMFSVSTLAAGPLKMNGKVVDSKSGEAVAGAVVRLDGNYLWAVPTSTESSALTVCSRETMT